MKTTIQFPSHASLTLLLLFASCNKNKINNDILPPLTFEGKNTIGCKINGEAWVPKGITNSAGILYPVDGGYYGTPFFPGVHILIQTNDPGRIIELFWRNYNGNNTIPLGKYYFNKTTEDIVFGNGEIHSYGFLRINGKNYFTDSTHTGWIEILKADSVICGRFEFAGYNTSDGKTYHITDGRFDVK
jgi:hypothetical protein